MHPLVALARRAVEEHILPGREPEPPGPLPDELRGRAGVFVCLKKHGRLRGCIGTIEPTQPTIAEEAARNAVSAATCDPRFPPVSPAELDDMEYSVDVLMPPEPVDDLCRLDPKRYGVIVSKGGKRGLLLPDLEGVDTKEEQLRIAMMKACIDPSEGGVRIERFLVRRYK